jgi:lysyl-tRNA synthetase class 2
MSWQATLSWENAQHRAKIIAKIRLFFSNKNVTEVETPLLSQGTITDIHLEAFESRYKFLADLNTDQYQSMYLQTSPEFAMKRLLASGYGCIYQITKAFRHEEHGRHHNPEFTMLEWYRVGFNHIDLMAEVAELLVSVLACEAPTQTSYQALFVEHVGIDPLNTTKKALTALLKNHNKLDDWLIAEPDIDILLQFVFSEIIEQHIGINAPCFVYNFPASQASLAKICNKDSRVAERFECYYHGIELVNGFNELTDAKAQQQRFDQDNHKRKRNNLTCKPIDKNFINALTAGLPQCAGVALGIDRLIMIALNCKHIENVITFPISTA